MGWDQLQQILRENRERAFREDPSRTNVLGRPPVACPHDGTLLHDVPPIVREAQALSALGGLVHPVVFDRATALKHCPFCGWVYP